MFVRLNIFKVVLLGFFSPKHAIKLKFSPKRTAAKLNVVEILNSPGITFLISSKVTGSVDHMELYLLVISGQKPKPELVKFEVFWQENNISILLVVNTS